MTDPMQPYLCTADHPWSAGIKHIRYTMVLHPDALPVQPEDRKPGDIGLARACPHCGCRWDDAGFHP